MRLSEAIRLGAMLHPQTFGRVGRYDDGAKVVATCALGAAKEAGYFVGGLFAVRCERQRCPDAKCLYGRRRRVYLTSWIAHLNDKHRWTREQIADWVDTVGRSLEDVAVGRDDKRVASEVDAPVSAQRGKGVEETLVKTGTHE